MRCDDVRLAVAVMVLAVVAAVLIVACGVVAGYVAHDRIVARARRVEAAALATLRALGAVGLVVQAEKEAHDERPGAEQR